ncbi:hypothetical protein M378DRAFT_165112, partial [Amanita muscaria Koide BX008]
ETKPFTGRAHTLYDSHAGQGKSNSSVAAPVQSEAPVTLGINLYADRHFGNLNFGNRSTNEGNIFKGTKTSSDANKTTPMTPGPGVGFANGDKDTLMFKVFDGNINVGHEQKNKGNTYEESKS